MKIFQFKEKSGSNDFVCAETIVDAIKEHWDKTDRNISDWDDEEFTLLDILEIPESEWESHKLTIEDEPDIKNFADFMKQAAEPELFCNSNWEHGDPEIE